MTRIIRAPSPAPGARRRPAPDGTRLIHAAQLAAQREAEALIARAQAEAAELVQRARDSSEALAASVREEAKLEAARLLASVELQTRARLEASEAELTELGVGIAQKILAAELELHPEQVAKIVAGCLRRAASARRILIRVSPEDAPAVEAAMIELGAGLPTPAQLELQADRSITRGGCVLLTEAGQVDGKLETQLAALREALRR